MFWQSFEKCHIPLLTRQKVPKKHSRKSFSADGIFSLRNHPAGAGVIEQAAGIHHGADVAGRSFFWRQFTDESPRDFGGLAVVVSHFEMAAKLVIHFHVLRNGLHGDFIGLADGGMGFEKTEAVFKFHVKGVFPTKKADMAHTGERPIAIGFFELHGCFHKRFSSFKS